MADLPEDFDAWSNLLEQLTNSFNQVVERTFINIEFDLTTTLGGMYVACLIQPDDTVNMIILRLFLFYFCYQGNLPTPIYGIPTDTYQADVTFRPQVILYFLEDNSEFLLENNLPRADARISFRLVNQTYLTITPTIAMELATSIKEIFALNGGYVWEKGTLKVTYFDPANGYDFRLYVNSQEVATTVIESVLEIQGTTYDQTKLSVHQNNVNYPVVPGSAEIFGKNRTLPRKRPITNVRFTYAEMIIWGIPTAITLVDRTGKRVGLVQPF
jgi:hypothetical protein